VEKLDWNASYDVVVFGAGYSGLLAANRLLEKEKSVLIVEPEPGITHKSYYGGISPDGRVYVSKEHVRLISDLDPRIVDSDDNGMWVYGFELLVRLLAEAFRRGATMLVDSLIEPIFKRDNGDEFTVTGVAVRSFDSDYSETYLQARANTIIDATGNATLASLVLDRLKIELPTNGVGPIIPGSTEVSERTGWLIPGIIVAGIGVSQITGVPLPFPDIGPLLASGVRAAELALKGYESGGRSNHLFTVI
jgi:ribulose 1,5-bisphosphate synthetase/thiazole synthase